MRLAEFIEQHHGKIVAEWVEFARTLLPWAKGLSDKALRDHAEELLIAVVDDMRTPQSKSEQTEKSKGEADEGPLGRVGHKHASERLATGLNLNQLISEYRALRASILRLWAEAQGDKGGELTRFNEAIDETLAESASRYSDTVNDTREQFLAILGHDLRNPLSAIIMGATTLTSSESLGDTDARVAVRIFSSAERMKRMISDLLDLTRTRLGSGIPVTATSTDLAAVCKQAISELEAIHPECELRFRATGNLRGQWDSDRLTQVLSNLVANALQYGCASGAVNVVAQDEGEEVMFSVQNRGPLIPANDLRRIFDPMVRATNNGGKNPTGLGLGLYIAREVVTAHAGTIGVTSTEGEGTTFTVRIPRRPRTANTLNA